MKATCLYLTAVAVCSLAQECNAFAPPAFRSRGGAIPTARHSISEELGLPCEDECALKSFPNLPESVHPGVLSGQPMLDLLKHAKENGTFIYLLID
jgi:fructose-bisphosphate aldolase class II